MKIPKNAPSVRRDEMVDDFNKAARELSAEYGVYIKVCGSFIDNVKELSHMTRIFFAVMEHEFDGIRDLKKALRLKAFA